MTTTKTRPDLDTVLKAVADAGFPLTEKETEVVRRRLARNGRHLGRPDPLSGKETDPVAAVDHLYDERGGPLARNIEGPPPVASLIDGYEVPEDKNETERLQEENEALRKQVEALKIGGPGHLARVEQVTEASAGPLDTSGGPGEEHLAAKVGTEVKADKPEPKASKS